MKKQKCAFLFLFARTVWLGPTGELLQNTVHAGASARACRKVIIPNIMYIPDIPESEVVAIFK